MTTAERIRSKRLEKGLTQKALGERCGIVESQIRKYEIKKGEPKLSTLKRIAKGLECPVIELLDLED